MSLCDVISVLTPLCCYCHFLLTVSLCDEHLHQNLQIENVQSASGDSRTAMSITCGDVTSGMQLQAVSGE